MRIRKISRWQASGLHLLISAAIAAVALAVMLLVWYPPPLFEAEGGSGLVILLGAVDVILGPLVTLIVFRAGKRGMKFDLAVIGIVQAAALAYGVHVVFLARPAFLVFVQGQFEIAHPVDIEPAELARAKSPQFGSLPLGAPRWAVARLPQDPAERSELTMKALGGADLQSFPRYWVPYEEGRGDVLERAMSFERLRAREPKYAALVEKHLAGSGSAAADARFALLRARRAWVVVILDARTAAPRSMLVVERN